MNAPSGKISPEENHSVFEMLGDRRQSLSTAVIQLFIATNSYPRNWQLVVTGVACFVKDSVRRGYYIQVQDCLKGSSVCSQYLYIFISMFQTIIVSTSLGLLMQVFDMDNRQRIWEQELYNEMIYKTPHDWFHTFEGDSAMIGLSFVDNREADDFKGVVTER